jgi:hypothetical protein
MSVPRTSTPCRTSGSRTTILDHVYPPSMRSRASNCKLSSSSNDHIRSHPLTSSCWSLIALSLLPLFRSDSSWERKRSTFLSSSLGTSMPVRSCDFLFLPTKLGCLLACLLACSLARSVVRQDLLVLAAGSKLRTCFDRSDLDKIKCTSGPARLIRFPSSSLSSFPSLLRPSLAPSLADQQESRRPLAT